MSNWKFVDPNSTIRIYVPYECLHCPSGIILGWFDKSTKIICLTGIVYSESVHTSNTINDWLTISSSDGYSDIRQLGQWITEEEYVTMKPKIYSTFILKCDLLMYKIEKQMPRVILNEKWGKQKTIVILFSAMRFQQSSFLMHDFIENLKNQNDNYLTTHVEQLSKALFYQRNLMKLSKVPNLKINDTSRSSNIMFFTVLSQNILIIFKILILFIFYILNNILELRIFGRKYIQIFLGIPYFGQNMLNQIKYLKNISKFNIDHPGNKLKMLNFLTRKFIDIFFGIIIIVLASQFFNSENCSNDILALANVVLEKLQFLIDWLKGNPAGLKLNNKLSHVLGTFFQYHFYLWKGYLNIMKSYLPLLLNFSFWIGIFGTSYQISLLLDIFKLMTLHIYCFYVYASHLYRLQTKSLLSLFLLFRGKKQNVLRNRIDSLSYDMDTLFVGTLFFCIILFLFPTILVYYIVFAFLRILLIILEVIPRKIIKLLNHIPLYSIILKFLGSSLIKNSVTFHRLEEHFEGTLYLWMVLQSASFRELYIYDLIKKDDERLSIFSIVKQLFKGELIYPWIKKK